MNELADGKKLCQLIYKIHPETYKTMGYAMIRLLGCFEAGLCVLFRGIYGFLILLGRFGF